MNSDKSPAQTTSSPSKPETCCLPNIPEEDAQYIYSTRCPSPSLCSSVSNQESLDSFSLFEPNAIITDEMVKEEEQLFMSGVQKENERLEEEKNWKQANSETREERYERLKFLLSKSKMYTEYLVNRIKKQKSEEDQRKKKQKVKNSPETLESDQKDSTDDKSPQSMKDGNGPKRKHDSSGPNSKRQKISDHEMPAPEINTVEKTESPVTSKGKAANREEENDAIHDEPELIEKALTFGISDALKKKRYINGVEVPCLQPELLVGGILRPYQIEGYSWLKVMFENGVNGILADEMGLGKTIQCIAILSHLVYMGVPGPFLVVAPLSTIPNWLSEFQLFAPSVPVVLFHGSKDVRAQLVRRISKQYKIRENVSVQPVVITSYEVTMVERKMLARHNWKYLIVDEGHRIKNTHCRLIRELRMYKSTHRLLLTGTPLQNNLSELWSLLNFLLPEIFDDLGSFETWFDVNFINDSESEEKIVTQEKSESILSIMHQILSPFMLRRLKSDVDLNIPPKKEIVVYAPLTQQQKDFYSAIMDKRILNLLKAKEEPASVEQPQAGRAKRRSAKNVQYQMFMETEQESKRSKRSNKSGRKKHSVNQEDEEAELEHWVQAVSDYNCKKESKEESVKKSQITVKMCSEMMQLRKCCNHPFLLEHPIDPKTGDLALSEEIISSSGKMRVLDQMLAELKKRGHRVLLFSQMTRMLDLIEDFCHLRKYSYCRLDGSTNIEDRKENMNEFNKPGSDKFIFLLSTRAGGLGINLVAADTVIIYDSDWNPQCDLQAQDRCHRIGQDKPVVVYRFVAANTIDEKIIEKAAAKRKLEKMIIHKGKFKSGNLMAKEKAVSPEELRALLQSKDHDAVVSRDNFTISRAEMNSLLDRSDLLEKWRAAGKIVEEKKLGSVKVKGKKPKKGQSQFKLFKVIECDAASSSDIQCESVETLDQTLLACSADDKQDSS